MKMFQTVIISAGKDRIPELLDSESSIRLRVFDDHSLSP